MMSNKTRSTLYIGVTNDLLVRVAQHRRGEIPALLKIIIAPAWFTVRISVIFGMRLRGRTS
jgi:hypothetical protein